MKRADWPQQPGRRVRARRDREGRASRLRPRPSARELLRRLSFDLIGLPPTPEEVHAFLADTSPGAYERQVDRLLASPHFGERMAVYWLDLVRYADSVGYHSDNPRTVWRYRDYVIDAFNRNLPFDQFTTEQLAGDLLPDAVAGAADRLRLQPAAPDHRGGRRPAEGVPRHLPRRPRAERLDGLAGRDRRLRPVPRPQVRPVPRPGLLQLRAPSSRT